MTVFNFLFRKLSHKLDELKKMIQDAVVSRVVEDFVDINTPLKQFTDAVHVPKGWLQPITCYLYLISNSYEINLHLKVLLVEKRILLIKLVDCPIGQNVLVVQDVL